MLDERLDVRCQICTGTSRRIFAKNGHWIRECDGCRHRFAEIVAGASHVSEVYGDEYFFGGGAGYRDYLAEATLLRERGQGYAKIVRPYTNPGTMLDVGAAAGFLLKGFEDCGWTGRGIEPNARMAAHARSTLGVAVEVGTLEGLEEGSRYDLITMIQVVPHFFDVRRAFAAAANATNKGGFWLIETWNRESLTARLFGQGWHEYSPPSVLHWFSRGSLARLAGEFGLREVAHGRPSKWIGGAHAKSLLAHTLGPSGRSRLATSMIGLIPDRLSLPYPAEDLFWILLRKD